MAVLSHTLPADLKILHVLDHSVPLQSGYSFRTLALLREQERRGWRTVQLTSPKHTKSGPEIEEVGNLRFYRTPAATGIGSTASPLAEMRLVHGLARRIIKVARIEQPHVLHAHSPALNAMACLLANQTLKLPLVYEVRAFWEDAAVSNGATTKDSLRYQLTRSLETFALRNSDAITTICEGLRQDMIGRRLPSERIAIVPNGVDLERFPFLNRSTPSSAAQMLRRSLGLEKAVIVGFLGSFYPYEGLYELLSALPAVLQRAPEMRVLLAGGGPEDTKLKELVLSLGVGDAVRFVGRVPHEEILTYYELIDIFAFPRRLERLTEIVTPLKPLEAMATGGIVLASDVGGHRELIVNGETGYLFSGGSSECLGASLLRILENRASWPAVRIRARRYVEESRTWTRCASAYDSVYDAATREAARGCG